MFSSPTVKLASIEIGEKVVMKKLLAMAAIAGMAFGAQASYTYTWNIDINDIDPGYTPPSDLKAWLRDANTGATIAALSFTLFNGKTATEYSLDVSKANDLAKSLTLDTTYKSGGITIGEDPSHAGQVNYKTTVEFDTSRNLTTEYKNDPTKSLKVVLEGTSVDTKQYLVQEIPVIWSIDTQFGAAASYDPSPVPEPTSGMLVFLGLAGLMLKRKRAA